MIRPLEFCEKISHIQSSIETIDERIEELVKLKNQYLQKEKTLVEAPEIAYDELHLKPLAPSSFSNKLAMTNKKVLVIDNYDSFTYNLVHLLQELNVEYEVWRNDKFQLEDIVPFQKILLSPGPGIPEEAGLLMPLIKKYAATKSILGICLGQQAIAEVFGGSLFNMEKPLHGVSTEIIITDDSETLYNNFPRDSKIGRYHSWAVDPLTLPDTLSITAVDAQGTIMGLSHKSLDVKGMQFHPESVLTENGKILIENWINK